MKTLPPQHPALTLLRIVDEDGRLVGNAPRLTEETLARMFRNMLRVQLVDERMVQKHRQGKVGFYGAVTGQEAVPVAAAAAVEMRDWVFPALRESAIMLCRGFPLSRWIAQVYGNEADLLKGRQMPSHMSARSVHQVSWSSSVGTQLPHAVGAAWAAKHRGDSNVVVTFLGDGATSQCGFHSAMNLAGVFQLPCVFVCQNNSWSISVPAKRQTSSITFAIKAHAYGMESMRADGNDVLAMYATIRAAVERAREGRGPTLIEAVTYRVGPHSSSDDPNAYRSEAEVEKWKRANPIDRFERYLLRQGVLATWARGELETEIHDEISDAIRRVENLPPPDSNSLFDDVFEEIPWHLADQKQELASLGRKRKEEP